jgi:hypothetical protein
MAMDSLASVAHAAGFAMVPEDDVPGSEFKSVIPKAAVGPAFVSYKTTADAARWQGSTQPVTDASTAAANNGIFDWMPSFSWRADGR